MVGYEVFSDHLDRSVVRLIEEAKNPSLAIGFGLLLGSAGTGELAEMTDLGESEVLQLIGELAAGGRVDRYALTYSLTEQGRSAVLTSARGLPSTF